VSRSRNLKKYSQAIDSALKKFEAVRLELVERPVHQGASTGSARTELNLHRAGSIVSQEVKELGGNDEAMKDLLLNKTILINTPFNLISSMPSLVI
jgi:hypothetical protein